MTVSNEEDLTMDPLPGMMTPSAATARYVHDRFSVGGDLTLSPVARGLCGRVWRLGGGRGRYALKELFWDDDQDEQEVGHRAAFEGAARETGVRCPVSLPTRDGTYLCRLPASLGDVFVRLYTWIDGTPLTEPAQPGAWLGRILGRLHQLRHPAVIPPRPKFGTVPPAAQWADLLAALRRARVPWLGRLEAVLPVVEDLATLVTPTDRAEMIMCHMDIRPENVMRDRAGELVLLDWDNAGAGSAEQELGAALMDWHVHAGRPQPAAIEVTMRSYRDAGGPASIAGLTSFSAYLGAVINHLYTQGRVATAEDARAEHRELAHAEIEDMLDSLPSRELLAEVGHIAGLSTR